MPYFAIILLIVLGIFLLLIEFLVIPGVTIFGIGGFLFIMAGIAFAYYFHGASAGNYTLLATALASLLIIFFVFKQKTWRRIGLDADIKSKVEPFETARIQPGDRGKTITRLAPVGKVMVNDIICEARSTGNYIRENTEIEVIQVLTTQIIVKPINQLS